MNRNDFLHFSAPCFLQEFFIRVKMRCDLRSTAQASWEAAEWSVANPIKRDRSLRMSACGERRRPGACRATFLQSDSHTGQTSIEATKPVDSVVTGNSLYHADSCQRLLAVPLIECTRHCTRHCHCARRKKEKMRA